MEKQIEYLETNDGKCPYTEWLESLDFSVQARVLKRIDKLKKGLYGDCKPLQNSELSELRFDFGKGYRIYYKEIDNVIILIVAGGDKSDQKRLIKQAGKYFKEYKKGEQK